MKIANAKKHPEVYYGLHMSSGVAEYSEPQVQEGQPYRLFIGDTCLNQMDITFVGKPVYVHHVDQVDLEKIQTEADGFVVESFFNKLDGKHWAKFIVVSDKGHEAIQNGWRLSNAYMPKDFSGGGKCHNVDYQKEVIRGEYEHLAIVPNPRYEESIILTPEQFKAYNSEKELELQKIANSKGEPRMFNFFKKTKLENAAEIEGATVTLSSGAERTIGQLINEVEAIEKEKMNVEKEKAEGKAPMANGDHMVKVGDDEMTVNELIEKHMAMKKDAAGSEEKKVEPSDEEKKNAEDAAKKKADEDAALADAEKKKNDEKAALEKEEEVKKNAHFNALKNAGLKSEDTQVDLSVDKVQRGVSRYGSSS